MIISELYIHPIKSAAAIAVDSLTYIDLGPKYDRQWVLVDQNGTFISQRSLPKLCFIRPSVKGSKLTVEAPGQPPIHVTHNGEQSKLSIWNDQVVGQDCGNEIAIYLSEYLGKPCRLIEVSPATQRLVDTNYAKAGQLVGFADGFPTLIANKASLEEFNGHLESPIDMRRFRPNIVVDGDQPYVEDQWRSLQINKIRFDLVKPCSRCIMPSINPETAGKDMQVNDVLLKTRRRDGKTYFGQNALHQGVGKISIGDVVELIL